MAKQTRRLESNWQSILNETIYSGQWMIHAPIAKGVLLNLRDWSTADFSIKSSIEDSGGLVTPPSCFFNDGSDTYFNFDDAPHNVVAVIPLKGTMLKHGTWRTYGTLEIAAMIREAAGNEKVIAVVIDCHSGGGTSESVSPIHEAIAYTKSQNKPIISSIDMSLSANYYAIAPSDLIVANNGISSQFGSIGVMWSYYNVIPYMEKEGVEYHEVYSNYSEEKNKIFLDALKGDYESIKDEYLDPVAIKFRDDVIRFRGDKLNQDFRGILKGRILYAQDALENGLIDHIGTHNSAIQLALDRAQINTYLNP